MKKKKLNFIMQKNYQTTKISKTGRKMLSQAIRKEKNVRSMVLHSHQQLTVTLSVNGLNFPIGTDRLIKYIKRNK